MSFYVTTPIYYVNAAPHLGHAYSTIAADVMARHMRQRGEDVFFLTGTDEHGEPVALAAEKRGRQRRRSSSTATPRASAALMPRLNASNDFFIRTTDPEHKAKVQEILSTIRDNGHVYKGTYEGWYCPRCADFKTEAEAGEDHRARSTASRSCARRRTTTSSACRPSRTTCCASTTSSRTSSCRATATTRRARSSPAGCRTSRSAGRRCDGASTCRGTPTHVFYVWFDALLNYYTALGYARDGEDLTERFWPAQFHLIGKDILKFHTVFWPAMLMAAGLPLPEHVFVHGFLLMRDDAGEEHKMSKSLGNVLDPFVVMDEFGTDALRYYCMREVSFGHDGSVSAAGFAARYESELANDFGNLASRTIAMVHRYRDGTVPDAEPDSGLAAELDAMAGEICALLDGADLSGALDAAWQRVRRLNRYVEEQAPWTLAKDEALAADLDRVLSSLAEGLRVVAVVLHPWLPESTEKLLAALGAPEIELDGARMQAGRLGAIAKLAPLFPKPQG